MKPYNNPKIFLANLVRFEYNKENKSYDTNVLDAKIPVVFIPSYGYYTNIAINNISKEPLSIIDLENKGTFNPNRYYLINVRPLSKFFDGEDFVSDLYVNLYNINSRLGATGEWINIDDYTKDEGFYEFTPKFEDFKIDESLYVAKLVSRVIRTNFDENGHKNADEYIHISGNYGIFKKDKFGNYISRLSDITYNKLNNEDILNLSLKKLSDRNDFNNIIYYKEDMGIIEVSDLHDFITKYHLFINPNKDILSQINSYKNIKNPHDIRNLNDFKLYAINPDLTKKQSNYLNQEIMRRTLRK